MPDLRQKIFTLAIAAVSSICGTTAMAVPVAAEQPDSAATALAVFVGGVVNNSFANFEKMGLTVDKDHFRAELMKVLSGEKVIMDAAQADAYLSRCFEELRMERESTVAEADSVAEAKFLERAASRPGAVTLPSGLVFETLLEGVGTPPDSTQTVAMRYRGTLSDGSVFDEIPADEAPVDFPSGDLTPGFTEGLMKMRPGGRYRITMPASLAYGSEGIPGIIPPGAALCFEVELVDVKK